MKIKMKYLRQRTVALLSICIVIGCNNSNKNTFSVINQEQAIFESIEYNSSKNEHFERKKSVESTSSKRQNYQKLIRQVYSYDGSCRIHIIKSGLDENDNGILDKNEINSTIKDFINGNPISKKRLSKMISLGNDVSAVNTCQIKDMSFLFSRLSLRNFNQDISKWNTSAVTSMQSMFSNLLIFNQDISQWDVSSVENMSSMFYGTSMFNQDISQWDVSAVTNMKSMFSYTQHFDQNISSWEVSSVRNMGSMFSYTQTFNQDISHWDVSSVTDMNYMFAYAQSFDQNISSWDVSSVKKHHVFGYASILYKTDKLPIFPRQ